ncbi:hypothetical protein POM88_000568 [Heracleum sosnowskyi]|uniref:Uncharacterized protein n=1 Tax=Heracleum sosnowskyi TaxID=360622 RepID=A0AAD8JD97_9APIA|nr:hypothetical protein POM88_000568 [Heracleum sosnowskyi]
MREIDSRKNEVEEDARKLESKRQELEEGFKEFYSKKIEFAGISSSIAARFAEIEERNLNLNARTNELNSREMEVERSQVLCAKKSEETENKMREINSARERMEEYVKELESKQKELENGFKELESKRMEFSKMTNESADNNISSAETSKNPIKRKRTSLRRRRRTNTELPAPQVSQTVVNQNSDGTETFWTLCAHCQFIFQYTKLVVNKELTCTHCSNKFTAYELDAASSPPVNYSMVDLKYFPKTDVTPGDNGGGSGSVQQ